MNTKFFWTIALFILIYINPVHAQNNTAKAVQIQLEGIGLDSFTIEVKGNEILINGKSPDSSGMKLLFVKTDTHTGNKMISEHGIEYRPEVKASVPVAEPYRGVPWLGLITLQDEKGVKVIEVVKNGPASKSEIRNGDYISTIDDVRIKSQDQLSEIINAASPGDRINVKTIRGVSVKIFQIIIGDKNYDGSLMPSKRVALPAVRENTPIGMQMKLTKDEKNWKIVSIASGSRAEAAGLILNDVVLEMGGMTLKPNTDLEKLVSAVGADNVIPVKIKRNGKFMNLEIKK